MNKKNLIIIIVAAVVAASGAITGVYAYNSHKDRVKPTQTQTTESTTSSASTTTTTSAATTTTTTTATTTATTTTTTTSAAATKPAATTQKTNQTTKKPTTTTTKKTTTTTKKTTTTTKAPSSIPVRSGVNCSESFERECMASINRARNKYGVSSVKYNMTMAKLAGVRAVEISNNFSHTRPGGKKSYSIYNDYGLTKPKAVGECIAYATRFDGTDDIIDYWMTSKDGHREVLLSSKYSYFGMAEYTANGKTYAVLLLSNSVSF